MIHLVSDLIEVVQGDFWTGYVPATGVVLVAAASGLGNHERTLAAAVPDAAFIGMGLALLRDHRRAAL